MAARPCLLYLAPGPNPDLPWGGLHITVVGRCASGAGATPAGLRAAARAALRDPAAQPPLLPAHPAQWEPRLSQWRVSGERLFVVGFQKAPPLDSFAVALASRGVGNVKGPAAAGGGSGRSRWHLTLPKGVARDEAAARAVVEGQLLLGGDGHAASWGLWVVTEEEAAADPSGAGGRYSWEPL